MSRRGSESEEDETERSLRLLRIEEAKHAWFKIETFPTSGVLACLDRDGLVNLAKLKQECQPGQVYHFMPHLNHEASIAAMDAGIHVSLFHGKSMDYFTETVRKLNKSPHLPKAAFVFRSCDTESISIQKQLQTLIAFYEYIAISSHGGTTTMVVEFLRNK